MVDVTIICESKLDYETWTVHKTSRDRPEHQGAALSEVRFIEYPVNNSVQKNKGVNNESGSEWFTELEPLAINNLRS